MVAPKPKDDQSKKKTPKARKLALHYKRNADDNRRKKYGDEIASESCEAAETPNFSRINSRMGHIDERSPDKVMIPPKPSLQPSKSVQIIDNVAIQ
jgi:hypothetical protein